MNEVVDEITALDTGFADALLEYERAKMMRIKWQIVK
jgi:hypothetical protein